MLILDVEFDARDNYQSVAPCIRDRPGILPYLTMVGYRDNIEPELDSTIDKIFRRVLNVIPRIAADVAVQVGLESRHYDLTVPVKISLSAGALARQRLSR